MKKFAIFGVVSAVALASPSAFAQTANPAPAKPAPVQTISAKDKQSGAQAHPQLLAEFGGAYTEGTQSAYVTRIGQKIAMQSGIANAEKDVTVTLLNSPVNNAFAIPGGYIYVTRQLMGLMNNEAELGSVLGHEWGHVMGRHSKKRNDRSLIGGLATIAGAVLGGMAGGSQGAQLGQQLAGGVAQSMVLGYSRGQEYEADDYGIKYLYSAGYDTMASSTILASLAAQTSLDMKRAGKSEKSLPEWASTHPEPEKRVARAQQTANRIGGVGRERNADAFISQLNGMLYDDDPKQGIIEGQTFKHADLKLAFTAPDGFTMNNGAAEVTMGGSSGKASFGQHGGSFTGNLDTYLANAFKAIGGQSVTLNYGEIAHSTVNTLPIAYATANTQTQSGTQVRVTIYAYQFDEKTAFSIVGISPLSVSDPFNSLYTSVKRLTAAQAAAIHPRRIQVITVNAGDTVESLAARMAYTDYKVERFRVLNGLGSTGTIKAGQKVKLIVIG